VTTAETALTAQRAAAAAAKTSSGYLLRRKMTDIPRWWM